MKSNLEDQYRRAFSSDTEPVPVDLWKNIEAELDKKSNRKTPLVWFTFRKGMAASVAILMGLGLYIGYNNLNINKKQTNLVLETNKDQENGKDPLLSASKSIEKNPELALVVPSAITEKGETIKNNKSEVSTSKTNIYEKNTLKYSSEINNDKIITFKEELENKDMAINVLNKNKIEPIVVNIEKESVFQIEIYLLKSKEIAFLKTKSMLNRPALVMPLNEELSDKVIVKSKKIWLGLNSDISPFKPNFNETAIASASAIYSADNAFEAKMNTALSPQGAEKAFYPNTETEKGSATFFGVEVGKKLKKNFSIISGLRLGQARLTQKTNTLSIDNNSGKVSSYFASNFIDNKNESQQNLSAVNTSTSQYYDFIQVPVALAYQINIGSKLKAEIQAGLGADLFIQALYKGELISETKYKASNSAFKPINLSAQSKAGLNYKILNKWSFNLYAGLQKALFSGVETNVNFKPQFVGLGYGLRYEM